MIKKGDFLISTPDSLGDYYFNRSIIILTEVNKEEIVGFIVNKEMEYTLSDLDDSVIDKKIKIFSGGPVNQDNLYFIHMYPKSISNGINFYNKLYWGGEFKESIKEVAENIKENTLVIAESTIPARCILVGRHRHRLQPDRG